MAPQKCTLLLLLYKHLWNLGRFLFCCLSAQDFIISCPATGFTVGVNASVTCKVNKTAFAAACVYSPNRITFHIFTASGRSTTEKCNVNYTRTCPNTGSPLLAGGTCGCGCQTDDGTTSTHYFHFMPTAAQDGGALTCEVICTHTRALPSLTSDNCDAVAVGKLTIVQH